MASNTLMREEKNTYLGKTMLGTEKTLEFLDISESMLDKLCSNGALPYYNGTDSEGKTKGRLRYFKVDDLIKWQTSYYNPAVSIENLPKSVRKAS